MCGIVAYIGHKPAQARRRNRHTQPNEAEHGLGKDRGRDAERDRNDHRPQRVRQHVTKYDSRLACAERPCSDHVVALRKGEHLAANEAGDGHP